MQKTTSNKKNYVILAILALVVVILIAAVYLQGRKLSKFTGRPDKKSRTEIKEDSGSPGKSIPKDDEESYQKKITKLETRISDMQENQDNMEETLNEYGDRDAPEKDAVSQAREEFNQRRGLSAMYKDFFEQNNYPAELNEKLVDLYLEKMGAMYEHMMEVPEDWENPKDWSKNKEFNRQSEEIEARYYKKIAELLPEGGLDLFKEYENRSMERSLVYQFQII